MEGSVTSDYLKIIAANQPLTHVQVRSEVHGINPDASLTSGYVWDLTGPNGLNCLSRNLDGTIGAAGKVERLFFHCSRCRLREVCSEHMENNRIGNTTFGDKRLSRIMNQNRHHPDESTLPIDEALKLSRSVFDQLNLWLQHNQYEIDILLLHGSFASQLLDPNFSYVRPESDIDLIIPMRRDRYKYQSRILQPNNLWKVLNDDIDKHVQRNTHTWSIQPWDDFEELEDKLSGIFPPSFLSANILPIAKPGFEKQFRTQT